MSGLRRSGLLAMAAALLLAPCAAAAGTSVEVHLEPREVRPDGTVELTIQAEGDGIQQPRLRPRFELHNLEIVGGPHQTHGLRMGLGSGSWHYSWTWHLRPRSVGQAAVTSIRLLVGEREVELPPQRIRVSPDGSPGVEPRRPAPGAAGRSRLDALRDRLLDRREPGSDGPEPLEAGAEEIFLRAVAEPPAPFVGQRTVYTTYLYTRVPVRRTEPVELPEFEGCWAREAPVDMESSRETVTVEGVRYTRVPLYRRELYPLRSGVLDLGLVSARFVVERIDHDRSPFGPVRVPDQVLRQSNRIKLPVRDLPDPDGELTGPFEGPVGPLEVDARLEPSEVPVGRGATLTVTARGEGYMEALRPPAVRVAEGIDVLGPQEADPESPDGRAWTYLLVPRRSGSWELPPVEVTYFDPASEQYRTASSPLPRLEASPPAGRSDDAVRTLHPIRSAALPGPERRRWEGLLPWAFGIPWVLAAALLAARRRGGPWLPSARRRGAPDALDAFRRTLETARVEDRPRRAAAVVERAWRHFLDTSLGVPDATPTSGWPEELERRGVAREPCRRLAALLDDLHFLRYAPELSDAAALTGDLVARSERLARTLTHYGP